jgi:hypothetical protein
MIQILSAGLIALTTAWSTSAQTSNPSSVACAELASVYSEFTVFPSSTNGPKNYTFQVTNFWDKRSDLEPTCVFIPSNAAQVSSGVKIFHKHGAQFAVRGGGHMNVGSIHCCQPGQ